MPIVRMSVWEPLPGKEKDVEKLIDQLGQYHAELPGHVMGLRFHTVGREHMCGRLSIWNSVEDANHAASLTHTAALRSQIRFACASDEERLYEIQGPIHGALHL